MKILQNFIQSKCCNLVNNQCLGVNVNGNRLKKESSTTFIYQYSYKFEYRNAGLCWIQEGEFCDYFEKSVLPLAKDKKVSNAIIKEYSRIIDKNSMKLKSRFCECGAELSKGMRYCDKCRAKKRRMTKRNYQRNYRSS